MRGSEWIGPKGSSGGPVVLLVGNGDYSNRGCEAITRGTIDILRGALDEATFIDAHFTSGDALQRDLGHDVVSAPIPYPARWSPRWTCLKAAERTSERLARRLLYGRLGRSLSRCALVLSLGGDNFSLDYGNPRRFLTLNRIATEYGKPMIIRKRAEKFRLSIAARAQRAVSRDARPCFRHVALTL